MPILDIWINCPDRATAQIIADAVVERRLAACANIQSEIESVYRWRGAIERRREVPVLVKTRPDLFEPVAALARSLHPDDTPAIHALEAAFVTGDYRDWLLAETAAGDPPQPGDGQPR